MAHGYDAVAAIHAAERIAAEREKAKAAVLSDENMRGLMKAEGHWPLGLDEYQAGAASTWMRDPGPLTLFHLVTGLVEEAGEVAGKIKKWIRDDKPTAPEYRMSPERRAQIKAELGDVYWYAAILARYFGWTMSEVALDNLAKIADRKLRGVQHGEGDAR